MHDARIHRSFPRSMRRVDMWIWLTLHVYAILCLAGTGDLSPLGPLALLSGLQIIFAPALLIYMVITRGKLTQPGRLAGWIAVLSVLTAASIYVAKRTISQRALDDTALLAFYGSLFAPFIVVAGLLFWNVFLISMSLKAKRFVSAALISLISLVLAGLTFSPKKWMWREVPWGFYYAAVDQFGNSNRVKDQPSSFRRIHRAPDVGAEGGGASCQTEVYLDRAYSSEDSLSNKIAKLENFPGAAHFGSWHVVERAKAVAPNYVLAYTCY